MIKQNTRIENCFFWVILTLFISLLMAYIVFPFQYKKEINQAADEIHLDPYLIAATIKLESDYNPIAVSSSGAFGLMQLMPTTANWIMSKYTIQGGWREPTNNIRLGSFYLKSLLVQFDNNLNHAVNAYHMGPTRLKSLMDEHGRFASTSYSKRIRLYMLVYKILYDGYIL